MTTIATAAFHAILNNEAVRLDFIMNDSFKNGSPLLANTRQIDTKLSLSEFAFQNARKFDNDECLVVLEKHGIKFTDLIERNIDPGKLAKATRLKKMLGYILDRWPENLGDWKKKIDLHELVKEPFPGRLLVLLERGADINARDHYGRTPIMMARDAEVARVLIEAGADMMAVDNKGVSVIQYAVNNTLSKINTIKHGLPKEISFSDIGFLGQMVKNDRLFNDPRRIVLSKKIKRHFEAGLSLSGTVITALEAPSLANIRDQVARSLAMEKRERLERNVNKRVSKKEDDIKFVATHLKF